MKNIFKAIGAGTLLMAILTTVYAANTCQRSDVQCHTVGGSTVFRVDASGNITTAGTASTAGVGTYLSNVSLGVIGTGTSNSASAANTALSIPVMVSTAVSQGMVIIATTLNGTSPTLVNGVMSQSSNATGILGVADATASSGTVVNVDFSGLAVVLASGTIAVGDLLVSTVAANGYVYANNSGAAGAIVGTALVAQNASSPGLIRALLHH